MIAEAFTSWRGRKAETHGRAPAAPKEAPAAFPLFAEIKDEFLTAALVDQALDVAITPEGEGSVAKQAEALANAEVVAAVRNAAAWLCPSDEVLEIQIMTTKEVQFIRPLDPDGSMFLYASLDKEKGKYIDLTQMRLRMLELAFGL